MIAACQKRSLWFISAGGVYFSRVQIVEGEGVRFDPKQEVTPEMIHGNLSRIIDMKKSVGFYSITDEINKLLFPLMKDRDKLEDV